MVAVMDEQTRLAWGEIIDDLERLSIMFGALRTFNFLNLQYNIRFSAVMTDEKPEMACRDDAYRHPVERMMTELSIEHRYARRPVFRDNGKIKRLWRTVYDELLDINSFASVDELRLAFHEFLVYYNAVRPHQALEYLTPIKALESL